MQYEEATPGVEGVHEANATRALHRRHRRSSGRIPWRSAQINRFRLIFFVQQPIRSIYFPFPLPRRSHNRRFSNKTGIPPGLAWSGRQKKTIPRPYSVHVGATTYQSLSQMGYSTLGFSGIRITKFFASLIHLRLKLVRTPWRTLGRESHGPSHGNMLLLDFLNNLGNKPIHQINTDTSQKRKTSTTSLCFPAECIVLFTTPSFACLSEQLPVPPRIFSSPDGRRRTALCPPRSSSHGTSGGPLSFSYPSENLGTLKVCSSCWVGGCKKL